MSLFGDISRGLGDIATFGGNELFGNPIGNLAEQITNPRDSTQIANQQAFNLSQQNIQLQKDFAQNGISWRVADAARNGISPLAALGASTPGFSPVSAAFQAEPQSLGRDLLSAGASEMGQGLARSLLTTQSPMARQEAMLDLAWKARQNDLLDVQIANAKLELARSAGKPVISDAFRRLRNKDGSISIYPAEGIMTHNSLFGPTEWSMRNKLIPDMQGSFGGIGPRKSTSTWKWGGN